MLARRVLGRRGLFPGPAGLREVVFSGKIDVGRRLDDLIVPNVRKAVRWNSPWYGIEGEGWFVSYHVFTRYVKVNFLNGTSLRPVPPSSGKDKNSRWIDICEGELNEEQLAEWTRQAAALPSWGGF